MIVIPPQQQQGATPQKGDSKKGGATTTLTAFGLVLPIDQRSKKNNTTTTPNAQDRSTNKSRLQPSRNNSPRSQMDFDIQATQQSSDDDEYSSKLNHSHDAFEIQHKTQAMRDLDVLLGDNNDNDDEEEEEQKKEKEETSKKSQRRHRSKKKKSSPRHSKWLFQYTSDDIDDAVEDLISPFDGITNFMTCHRCEGGGDGDDDSIVDENDSIVAKGDIL